MGYGLSHHCCESAGWFIAEGIVPYRYDQPLGREYSADELEPYVFDKTFRQDVNSQDLDSGGQVAFRLVASGKPDLYLHIYNSHNGYYSHGFEFKNGDTVIDQGYL